MPAWTKNLVALAALVALVGCGDGGGEDDQEDAVRSVMAKLETASRQGDGDQICGEIFTPKLADSVTSSSTGGSCAEEVRANVFSADTKITIEEVTVNDAANAKATISEQNGRTSNVFLVKQGNEWRVRSVQPV